MHRLSTTTARPEAAVVSFGVLGPLTSSYGDVDVWLTAARQRTILALLLMRSNQPVSAWTLIDELWAEERTPPRALANLQTYICKLRGNLGPAGLRISTGADGYRLTASADEVDLLAFDRLRRDGHRAAAERDWERASANLTEALRLWRGQPLSDVLPGPELAHEVDCLNTWRLQTIETRIEADLHLGRHREVLGELQRLASSNPLHESLHRMYMLSCHRAGQRVEAVSAYRAVRRNLDSELGLRPSFELDRLLDRIEADDPRLMDLSVEVGAL